MDLARHASTLPPRAVVPFLAQQGVLRTAQLYDAGLDRRALAAEVRGGRLRRIRRGALTTGSLWRSSRSQSQHELAVRAVLLGLAGDPVVSHESAAVLHGLALARDPDLVSVTREGPVSSRVEAGVRHSRGTLAEGDVVEVRGLAVTSLARTAFDVARQAAIDVPAPLGPTRPVDGPDFRGLVTADAALGAGAARSELREVLERCRDWPGSRGAARCLLDADARAQSAGETLARLTFASVGLPADDLQVEVLVDGHRYFGDFAWRRWRVLGEFDGAVKYSRLLRPGETATDVLTAERRRELAIERAGWVVARFTWADLLDHALVRRRILEAVERAVRAGLAAA